ncbi:MAG: NUDIX pyrophosphatase [Bacteroidota bacterium]|nr:NUDIX pyrophosphatase [Bacteroidota bacterium]
MTQVASLYIEVCVFKFEKGKPEYLILQRSDTEIIYPGIFQFITGTIEEGETAIAAAKREMIEEINISHKNFWVIPFINPFYVYTRDVVNLSPMFLAEVENDKIPLLSPEHQTYEWCDYETALKRLNWHGQREALKIVNNFLTEKESRFTTC